MHIQCLSSMEFIRRISSVNKIVKSDTNSSEPATKLISNGHSSINSTTPSSSQSSLNQTIDQIKSNLLLNAKDLVAICPILLYQMTAATSTERSGCIRSDSVPANFNNGHFDRSDRGVDEQQMLEDEHNDRVLGKTLDFNILHNFLL